MINSRPLRPFYMTSVYGKYRVYDIRSSTFKHIKTFLNYSEALEYCEKMNEISLTFESLRTKEGRDSWVRKMSGKETKETQLNLLEQDKPMLKLNSTRTCWQTTDGRWVLVQNMEASHCLNVMNFLLSKAGSVKGRKQFPNHNPSFDFETNHAFLDEHINCYVALLNRFNYLYNERPEHTDIHRRLGKFPVSKCDTDLKILTSTIDKLSAEEKEKILHILISGVAK